ASSTHLSPYTTRFRSLHVQEIMGESVTILQENLVGIHVVKAFAAEEYEKQKYDRKAQELREDYFQTERLQGTNSAWMSLYFTCRSEEHTSELQSPDQL